MSGPGTFGPNYICKGIMIWPPFNSVSRSYIQGDITNFENTSQCFRRISLKVSQPAMVCNAPPPTIPCLPEQII